MNDADIEMAELAEAGRLSTAGVCPRCEEALDPRHPRWGYSEAEAASIASAYGPDAGDGFHEQCAWRPPYRRGTCSVCDLPEELDAAGRCRWCV